MAFVVKVEKAEFLGAAYPVEGERQVLRAGGGETADLYWGRLWETGRVPVGGGGKCLSEQKVVPVVSNPGHRRPQESGRGHLLSRQGEMEGLLR